MYNHTIPPTQGPTPDDRRKFDAQMDEAQRLAARYNDDFHIMPLKEHIRWIELVLQSTYMRKTEPYIPDFASELIEFYRYFIHRFGATSAKDVLEILSDRQVESEIVRLWIRDGLITDIPKHEPVLRAYSELWDELEQAEPQQIIHTFGAGTGHNHI